MLTKIGPHRLIKDPGRPSPSRRRFPPRRRTFSISIRKSCRISVRAFEPTELMAKLRLGPAGPPNQKLNLNVVGAEGEPVSTDLM